MASSRFPGKPLADILGKAMIEHCYHRASLADYIDETYVATCDRQILDHVKGFGGNAIMTSPQHERATTRTAEALELIEDIHNKTFDIVVMVQGDEPLISPETISQTISHFEDKEVNIVNIMSPIISKEQFLDKNNVKVVCNSYNNAMYFSRQPIPDNWADTENVSNFMQTGIIAFRRKALMDFNDMQESILERAESIDMNRLLEAGKQIRMVASKTISIGVDVPDELDEAKKMMKKDLFFDQYRNT
jgi:3-deoxy-manno-octulosonate cytidylyltransferase (CMP-KDO synthetase)